MPSSAGCGRSIRNTVAPRSASNIAHIGPGPMPASSTILMPASGPTSAFPHRVPLLIVPFLHGARAGSANTLHPTAAVDDDEVACDIGRFVRCKIREQIRKLDVLAKTAQWHTI